MANKEKPINTKGVKKARFWVKYKLEGEYLPSLPEYIFEMLFLEGRTAWSYKYSGTIEKENKKSIKIAFNITAVLKKEFHKFLEEHHFSFYVACLYFPETQQLKSIRITPI